MVLINWPLQDTNIWLYFYLQLETWRYYIPTEYINPCYYFLTRCSSFPNNFKHKTCGMKNSWLFGVIKECILEIKGWITKCLCYWTARTLVLSIKSSGKKGFIYYIFIIHIYSTFTKNIVFDYFDKSLEGGKVANFHRSVLLILCIFL